jgi:HSP20 family protein
MVLKFSNGQNPFVQLDRVLEDVAASFPSVSSFGLPATFRTDISEDDKAVYLEAELPGVKKDDVKISIEENLLTIRAERKAQPEEKKKNYIRTERTSGSVSRSFTLAENINRDAIEAEFADGVLHLTLPKMEPVKNVKEISIK